MKTGKLSSYFASDENNSKLTDLGLQRVIINGFLDIKQEYLMTNKAD